MEIAWDLWQHSQDLQTCSGIIIISHGHWQKSQKTKQQFTSSRSQRRSQESTKKKQEAKKKSRSDEEEAQEVKKKSRSDKEEAQEVKKCQVSIFFSRWSFTSVQR